MDVGVPGNTDGNESLTIYRDNLAGNNNSARVGLTPYSHTNSGSGGTALSGPKTVLRTTDLNGGANGGSRLGQASFVASIDSTYTVVFRGINNDNALEYWMPFPEVNRSEDCPRVHFSEAHDISGQCGVWGYYYNPENTSDKYRIYAQFQRRTTGGTATTSWSSTTSVIADDSTPDPPGLNISNGFRFAVPAAYRSATERTYVRLWTVWSNGATDWLRTGLNLGLCANWDYDPDLSLSGPSSPKPGQTFTITSPVRNTGNIRGDNYDHTIAVRSGGNWRTNASRDLEIDSYAETTQPIRENTTGAKAVIWEGRSGLGAGATATRRVTYRVLDDARHGDEICFEGVVRPAGANPTDSVDTTWDSEAPVREVCVTIFNERFDLSLQIALPAIGFPGDSVEASYYVCNDTDDELDLIPPAPRGSSPTTNIRTEGDLNPGINDNEVIGAGTPQCWRQEDVSIDIPTDAVVGDVLCARLRTSHNYGFSDGTSLGGHPVIFERCLKVADGPYLQALGHDTWAGGGYQIGGNCSVGSGNVDSHARQRVQSNGTPISGPGVGAMDQYALFAGGSVSGFGSQNNPLSGALTFANTPSLGSFGADDRCLANLFDEGTGSHPSGRVADALWDNADPIGNNFNGFGNNESGQFSISGTSTYNSSGNPFGNGFRGNATILISGDMEIRRNIILNTNNMSPGNTPFLLFIVAGDIRIQNNVSRLDGIYITYGQIDTCNTFRQGSLRPVDDLTAGAPCDEHLEVNGSLIANDIALRRTFGGTNEAATGNNTNRCLGAGGHYNDLNRRCSAETIIFPTWFWLANPFFDLGGGPESNQYPIQQIRDLPPIF